MVGEVWVSDVWIWVLSLGGGLVEGGGLVWW